jgi:peptidase E
MNKESETTETEENYKLVKNALEKMNCALESLLLCHSKHTNINKEIVKADIDGRGEEKQIKNK